MSDSAFVDRSAAAREKRDWNGRWRKRERVHFERLQIGKESEAIVMTDEHFITESLLLL